MTTELVSQLCHQGQLTEAVEALGVLVQKDCPVSRPFFYNVLKKCVVEKDLVLGRLVHALAVRKGYESDTFLCNHILRMYASHARLQEAMDVFTMVADPDVFMWSAVISCHVKLGQRKQAVQLYRGMRRSSVKPDGHVFVAALQACARAGDLETGKLVHDDVLASGVEPDLFVCNALVDMYAKCGSLEDAQRVFDGLAEKDSVTWTALIAGYCQQGMGHEALRLWSGMQDEGITAPDSVTFVCLLQACASVGFSALEKGKQLHAQIRHRGVVDDVLVANSLVNMYAKCGSLEDAQRIFDGLVQKDVVTWNAMITGYAKCGSLQDAQRLFEGFGKKNVVTWNTMIAGYSQQGMGLEALRLYHAMKDEGITSPDSVTFVCLLQACTSVGKVALDDGLQLHVQIRQQGFQGDVSIANSLVNMYAKCSNLKEARAVFDDLPQKDVVTWTTLIAGYTQQGMGDEALLLYKAMQNEGISAPDAVTFVCLLQACASVGIPALKTGRQLHGQIRERGLQGDIFVANSLVNMYAKCGSLVAAQIVFDGLGHKNAVTWNTMIAGCSQHGMGQEALHLYRAMQEDSTVVPNSVTFASLLQACATLGTVALEKGKQLHAHMREQGLEADVFVATSLVNMYAKCGSLENAQLVFDGLDEKATVLWSTLIAGYSQQGMDQQALHLYWAMQKEGIAATDRVTFICLLQACANVAALDLGRQLHAQIEEQGLQADVLVGVSLMNMYTKSGSTTDAQQVFDALPVRDEVAWNSLISGYTRQGDSAVVFHLFQNMIKDGVQPSGITFLCILTACSHAGQVKEGHEYFSAMSRDYGITPTAEHYTCMVDLLGRAGQLDEALAVISSIPVPPNAPVWHTLLGACRKWSNVDVGLRAFHEAVKLDKKDAAAYVLMSGIYTGAQMWEQARDLQARRIFIGASKQPGQTWWTDMDGLVHSFWVGNRMAPES